MIQSLGYAATDARSPLAPFRFERREPLPVNVFNLTGRRRQFAGSFIGGIAETQEMLDFCGRHGIVCDIEKIRIQDINHAYERLEKSDVKYRFVIDMASLAAPA